MRTRGFLSLGAFVALLISGKFFFFPNKKEDITITTEQQDH